MKVTKNVIVNQPQNFYTEVTMHSYEYIPQTGSNKSSAHNQSIKLKVPSMGM